MKYIKTFEYSKIKKIINTINNYDIDEIIKASKKGISPQSFLNLTDKLYSDIIKYLSEYYKKDADIIIQCQKEAKKINPFNKKVNTVDKKENNTQDVITRLHQINTIKKQQDNLARIDNLFDKYAGRHEELYDYIYYKASLGIIPQEALKLNDKEYLIFISKLPSYQKRKIEEIKNNISDYIDEELIKRLKQRNSYDKENKEFVFNTIIDGLKNGVSMIDTINTEFKDINVDNVLKMLTDKDKELINKYQRKMSNTPENIKRYASYGDTVKYEPNVIDPYEDFINSYQYNKYANIVKTINYDD